MKAKTIISWIILFFLVVYAGRLVSMYTDWLWFKSVGFEPVFIKTILAKAVAGTVFGVIFILILVVNFMVAWQWGKASSNKENIFDAYSGIFSSEAGIQLRNIAGTFFNRLYRIGFLLLILLGIIVGFGMRHHWVEYLTYFNNAGFNATDPLFGKDIGFYVFELPFIQIVYDFLNSSLIFAMFVIIVIYLFRMNIRILFKKLSIAKNARNHVFILIAAILLLKSYGYRLDMYNLLYSVHGVVFGATYSDINNFLPMLKVLMVLSAVCSVVFFVSVFAGNWVIPLGSICVVILAQFIAWIYPELVHKFVVLPNEIKIESPYISRNIEFTRAAYGLGKIEEKQFPVTYDLTLKDIKDNRASIDSVRLWDHRPLLSSFSQLQEIRTYYSFSDVSNDRYFIDGNYRQVMIAPRELDHEKLPSRIWINEHLTYTHGYGVVISPVNEVEAEGLPKFILKDIPPVSNTNIQLKRPGIYYGKLANDYIITNTKSKELDYPAGDVNEYTTYQGRGGVELKSFTRKLAYALKFGTLKLLLSQDITGGSRIHYYRKITERVREVMPLIKYDEDPYIVISEGELYWIIDGYTITNNYPYSQPFSHSVNYIRNAVKVVVGAYNGDISFYVSEPNDPIIQTYANIFPGVFKPLGEMQQDMRSHIRYPQDIFKIQIFVYSTYHMTTPQVMYNKEDLWNLPKEVSQGNEMSMEPYYVIMKLPGETKEEYILMQPFTPVNKDNMISWMAARSDGDNYGKLVVCRFPKDKLVYGPKQIEARIDQDDYISQQFTLWGQKGSEIIRGNLIVIPVKESLLYVEPVYLQAENGKIPELKRVIVAFGDRLVMEETLDTALNAVFAGARNQNLSSDKGSSGEKLSLRERAKRAWEHFQRSREYQKNGDWSGYGGELKELEKCLKALIEQK